MDGAQLRDLRVVGVKGSGSSPPAETFALEVWQALNVTVDDCTIDGQNVSATLFGGWRKEVSDELHATRNDG